MWADENTDQWSLITNCSNKQQSSLVLYPQWEHCWRGDPEHHPGKDIISVPLTSWAMELELTTKKNKLYLSWNIDVKKWFRPDTKWFLRFVNEPSLHFFMPWTYDFTFNTLQANIKITISNWLCLNERRFFIWTLITTLLALVPRLQYYTQYYTLYK